VVQRGIAAYEEGRREEGLAEWGRVIDRYPHTSAWGVAVFNTGYDLRERHLYREAIARFESLLGSDLDDRDPSGYLMNPCQNYQHQACLEISSCHEALGDYPLALRFAVLAQDRYPFQTWCGTCRMEEYRALEDRINRLKQRARRGE
jgi:tetratricopeptide (TPR) repeat protein